MGSLYMNTYECTACPYTANTAWMFQRHCRTARHIHNINVHRRESRGTLEEPPRCFGSPLNTPTLSSNTNTFIETSPSISEPTVMNWSEFLRDHLRVTKKDVQCIRTQDVSHVNRDLLERSLNALPPERRPLHYLPLERAFHLYENGVWEVEAEVDIKDNLIQEIGALERKRTLDILHHRETLRQYREALACAVRRDHLDPIIQDKYTRPEIRTILQGVSLPTSSNSKKIQEEDYDFVDEDDEFAVERTYRMCDLMNELERRQLEVLHRECTPEEIHVLDPMIRNRNHPVRKRVMLNQFRNVNN